MLGATMSMKIADIMLIRQERQTFVKSWLSGVCQFEF
jgi:hypothetical protein